MSAAERILQPAVDWRSRNNRGPLPSAGAMADALLRLSCGRPLAISIVIPTLDEADNVLQLFFKLQAALAGVEWEAIFVDDHSTDGTRDVLEKMAQSDRRVRVIHRVGRRGLSSAAIEGMLSSSAPVVAVIDADLQHDETLLPRFLEAIESGDCDLAVGSRYTTGGSLGDWGEGRVAMSRFATWLAERVTRTAMSDPMSGFFAVRREKIVAAAPRLSGTGYKILLDLVASSPQPLRIGEFAYSFRQRAAGQSKLDALVTLEYLQLLLEKTVGRFVPPKLILFSAVGSLGLLVQLAVLGFCLHFFALPFKITMVIATAVAMTSNYLLNNQLTYRNQRLRGRRLLTGFLKFCAACSLGAAVNVAVGDMVHAHQSWWIAGAAGAISGAIWNFAVGGALTWRNTR